MEIADNTPTKRWTVEDVMQMVETGLLDEDEPLELLDGRLVVVSPLGPPHRYSVTTIAALLRAIAGPGAVVYEEKPLVAGEHSLPEPDVALVRGQPTEFKTRHPRVDECELVVEVSRTSQARDREKISIYAKYGGPVYWLVDLKARRVEVHSSPTEDGRYASVALLGEDDEVEVPGRDTRLRVRDLLP
jgi:Uma2 family endonuclease